MLRQGNLGGELFSRTILGTTVAESVTSSKRKKQRQEKIDDQTKVCWSILLLLWSICSYFQQQHSLEEELASLKKRSKNSGKNSSFQLGTKRLGTVSRKKARKLSRTKLSAFLILFHKTQVLPRKFLRKKSFIVHEFKDSFGERLRQKTSARIFLTLSSNWWISC